MENDTKKRKSMTVRLDQDLYVKVMKHLIDCNKKFNQYVVDLIMADLEKEEAKERER